MKISVGNIIYKKLLFLMLFIVHLEGTDLKKPRRQPPTPSLQILLTAFKQKLSSNENSNKIVQQITDLQDKKQNPTAKELGILIDNLKNIPSITKSMKTQIQLLEKAQAQAQEKHIKKLKNRIGNISIATGIALLLWAAQDEYKKGKIDWQAWKALEAQLSSDQINKKTALWNMLKEFKNNHMDKKELFTLAKELAGLNLSITVPILLKR